MLTAFTRGYLHSLVSKEYRNNEQRAMAAQPRSELEDGPGGILRSVLPYVSRNAYRSLCRDIVRLDCRCTGAGGCFGYMCPRPPRVYANPHPRGGAKGPGMRVSLQKLVVWAYDHEQRFSEKTEHTSASEERRTKSALPLDTLSSRTRTRQICATAAPYSAMAGSASRSKHFYCINPKHIDLHRLVDARAAPAAAGPEARAERREQPSPVSAIERAIVEHAADDESSFQIAPTPSHSSVEREAHPVSTSAPRTLVLAIRRARDGDEWVVSGATVFGEDDER